MPITTSKLTTLVQLRMEAERVKQELGKYALTSSLGDLAIKSQITKSELAVALKNELEGKIDAANTMDTTAINSAIAAAIADSGHASFRKVAAVPEVADAADNVLYLVWNEETGHYDMYAKIQGSGSSYTMELIDDTTTDLTNYVTTTALNTAIDGLIKRTDISVTVTGTGNAITAASYDSNTGVLTLTKGAEYLTATDVPVATDAEVTTMLNEVFAA